MRQRLTTIGAERHTGGMGWTQQVLNETKCRPCSHEWEA